MSKMLRVRDSAELVVQKLSEEPEQKTTEDSFEYAAQAVTPLVSGEVKLVIGEKALVIASLFDVIELPFAEVNSISLNDYVVYIEADSGQYVFSRMGNWCQPFYSTLYAAYNKAVLRSLFVSGDALLTANGDYFFTENPISDTNQSGMYPQLRGRSSVQVYDNCVVSLPPDLCARRIPLCFVNGLENGDFELTLKMDSGELYTFAKLGYDTDPFKTMIEKQIRALRENSLTIVKEFDTSLSPIQASQIAGLMIEGAAAQLGRLTAISPSFVSALESKILETRAAESYRAFKEICDPSLIYIGFKKNDVPAETEVDDEALQQDPYLFCLIVPSPDGRFATVEFSEADSATFVYKTDGDFAAFAHQLNRALEAIDFKREVIRLTDEELRRPENADYYMASKRTVALQLVRGHFAGRVIHSSPETWKKKLLELWSQ